MPNLHSSVTTCTCDLVIAANETHPCDECGKKICVECRKPTSDPNLFVCSSRCRAILNTRLHVLALAGVAQ